MSRTADYPRPFDQLTDAELYELATTNGLTFSLRTYTLQLSAGPKQTDMLEVDFGVLSRERLPLLRGIDREMRRRWEAFRTFLRSRLTA